MRPLESPGHGRTAPADYGLFAQCPPSRSGGRSQNALWRPCKVRFSAALASSRELGISRGEVNQRPPASAASKYGIDTHFRVLNRTC